MIFKLTKFYKHYAKQWPTWHQFIKYNIIGVVNTIIDFVVYIGLTRFFVFWQEYFLWANAFSFLIANILSFSFNKRFTFKNNNPNITKQYIKFFIVSIIYLGIVQLILYVCVSIFELNDIVAKVVASAIGMFWNFYAHKYWSFRE